MVCFLKFFLCEDLKHFQQSKHEYTEPTSKEDKSLEYLIKAKQIQIPPPQTLHSKKKKKEKWPFRASHSCLTGEGTSQLTSHAMLLDWFS